MYKKYYIFNLKFDHDDKNNSLQSKIIVAFFVLSSLFFVIAVVLVALITGSVLWTIVTVITILILLTGSKIFRVLGRNRKI